jgi:hypothetical protein
MDPKHAEEPSWVVVSEYNVDEWPNAGLSPVPGKREVCAYPPALFAAVEVRFVELARQKKSDVVPRK